MLESRFNLSLFYARKSLGLTQAELAHRSRLNQGRISDIERGVVAASDDEQRSIAKALDTPISRLFVEALTTTTAAAAIVAASSDPDVPETFKDSIAVEMIKQIRREPMAVGFAAAAMARPGPDVAKAFGQDGDGLDDVRAGLLGAIINVAKAKLREEKSPDGRRLLSDFVDRFSSVISGDDVRKGGRR